METPGPELCSDALASTLYNSIQALGRGFDVTADIRLLYCKGAPGSRLVIVDEERTVDLRFEVLVLPDISVDIECSRQKGAVESSHVLSFHEMAEYFNEKSEISGCIPLGSFNENFNFSGSWQIDAAATKSLAMIGSFIRLYKVNLVNHILVLKDEVKRVVPYSWDRNWVTVKPI